MASSLFGRHARLACGPFRSLSSLYAERERPSAVGCAAHVDATRWSRNWLMPRSPEPLLRSGPLRVRAASIGRAYTAHRTFITFWAARTFGDLRGKVVCFCPGSPSQISRPIAVASRHRTSSIIRSFRSRSSQPRRKLRLGLSAICAKGGPLKYLDLPIAHSAGHFSKTSRKLIRNRPFSHQISCAPHIFAGPPCGPFHRRLRRLRCLPRRFDCYWASDPSQAGLTPAETHMHSRRTVRL